MKKNYGKRILALLLAVLMAMGLAGCGEKFDPKKFIQASLDLAAKHDVDQYVEVTGSSKKEAEEIYDEVMGELDNVFDSLEGTGIAYPDELKTGYTEYIKKVCAKTKYSVQEVKKEDNGYTVSVDVEPIKIFDGVQDKLTEKVQEYVVQKQEEALNGGETPNEQEVMTEVFKMMLDILNENLDNVTYGEKKTVTARIDKNSDGEYEVDDKSFTELGASLIDMTGIEEAGAGLAG